MARQQSGRGDSVPPLEWAAAAAGLAIALLLIATLLSQAIGARDEPPPQLTITADRSVGSAAGHAVAFTVSNASARTAAAVQVEGTLELGNETVDTGSATLDYVPGHSSARGGLVFRRDPRRHRLELRVTGYELP